MPVQIKFAHNWNNKLECKLFTTIRNWRKDKEEYYKACIGHIFDVMLSNNKIGEAVLRGAFVEDIQDIPVLILMLDTGMTSIPDILKLFKKFGVEEKVIVLLFERKENETGIAKEING